MPRTRSRRVAEDDVSDDITFLPDDDDESDDDDTSEDSDLAVLPDDASSDDWSSDFVGIDGDEDSYERATSSFWDEMIVSKKSDAMVSRMRSMTSMLNAIPVMKKISKKKKKRRRVFSASAPVREARRRRNPDQGSSGSRRNRRGTAASSSSSSPTPLYGKLVPDPDPKEHSVTPEEEAAGVLPCIVCRDKVQSCVIVPCGHKNVCTTCSQRLKPGIDPDTEASMVCPTCRSPISMITKVFGG